MGQRLLAWAVSPSESDAEVIHDAVLLAQAQARVDLPTAGHQPDNDDGGQSGEQQVLLRVRILLLAVQRALAAVNRRTLTLTPQIEQVGELYETLIYVQRAAHLITTRAIDPPTPASAPPTLQEIRHQQDLELNDELADHAARRETLAQSRCSPQTPPLRWHVQRYDPNGYFEAVHDDQQALLGPAYQGWVPVPEALKVLLRCWSVPADRDIDVVWECEQPWAPDELLPFGGWLPDHRGNDPHYTSSPAVDLEDAWNANRQAHVSRFSSMLQNVRQRWPGDLTDLTITEVLDRTAAHLNATQPLAPHLGQGLTDPTVSRVSDLGGGSDLVALGTSETAGWINPAAVAWTGNRWNDFASHRPATVPAMAKAMLTASVQQALKVWNLTGDPIRVTRIPGPAGPLYRRAENGTHRLHAARLLAMPVIWAQITQDTLPLDVCPMDVDAHNDTARLVLTCWKGLLAKGLATGSLQEDDLPGLSVLQLDHVITPWLLAQPDRAVAWAAVYDRVYPGALEEAGIPAMAWRTPDSWVAWLRAT
ncbi:hypothetical protein J5X84_42605 [Streptosporangiaceae bacterium NEAU-GS5]|nr:hypothetical protein [Streptosporangiaceae bacterium NEAU-GS5]